MNLAGKQLTDYLIAREQLTDYLITSFKVSVNRMTESTVVKITKAYAIRKQTPIIGNVEINAML